LFDVASNPEFLREGSAVTDFLYPDRIVVGVESARAAELMCQIYSPLTSGWYYGRADAIPRPEKAQVAPPRLIVTSAQSAEIIKHASNAFLAMKISFVNAVASICESVGANVEQVCDGIGTDSRIGPRFLKPGIGYGGSCFPKDLMAFRAVAKESGYDFRLLEEVIRINEDQRRRFLRKVRSVLWTLRGKRLGVLGLAFKGGTDDIRESPALLLVQELLREGCKVCAYDPAAMERAKEVLGNGAEFAAEDGEELSRGRESHVASVRWGTEETGWHPPGWQGACARGNGRRRQDRPDYRPDHERRVRPIRQRADCHGLCRDRICRRRHGSRFDRAGKGAAGPDRAIAIRRAPLSARIVKLSAGRER
jgi:UDP-glucose 6-dehydrogenase